MDGVVDDEALLKQAIKWGHKAIAITDHNGGSSLYLMYLILVTNYNKKLKEGEEPFKAIYGAELTLIDDTVNIVVRPNNKVMLDQTYCGI